MTSDNRSSASEPFTLFGSILTTGWLTASLGGSTDFGEDGSLFTVGTGVISIEELDWKKEHV